MMLSGFGIWCIRCRLWHSIRFHHAAVRTRRREQRRSTPPETCRWGGMCSSGVAFQWVRTFRPFFQAVADTSSSAAHALSFVCIRDAAKHASFFLTCSACVVSRGQKRDKQANWPGDTRACILVVCVLVCACVCVLIRIYVCAYGRLICSGLLIARFIRVL